MPDVDLGQTSGGAIEDAATASEADVIADLTGGAGVPETPAEAPKTPADAPAPKPDLPDPDPTPLFGPESTETAEPQTPQEEEAEAGEEAATEGLSAEEIAAVKEFADKHYQGSVVAAIKGIYETKSSSSALAKDLAALKDQFSSFVSGFNEEDDAPDEPATSPEVEEFDDTIKVLTAEVQDLRKTHQDTLIKINKADREIASLEGEMKRVPEEDREVLAARRDRMEDRKESLISKLDDLDSRFSSKQTEIKRAERSKTRAEKAAADKRTQEREGKTQQKERDAQVEDYFAQLVSTEAGSLDMDDDDTNEMHGVVRTELLKYLQGLPPGGPTVDMAAFVKARAKAYAERQEQKAAKLLRKRTAARKPSTPAPRPAAKPAPGKPARDPNLNTRSGPWDASFSRARARKVLGD
jgi:hypothetical protein